MYRTISKINARSQSYRKRLVLGSSVGVTLVIAMIWAITLPNRFGWNESAVAVDSVLATEEAVEVEEVARSPFAVFKESVANSARFAWQRGSAAAILSDGSIELGSGAAKLETFTDIDSAVDNVNKAVKLEFLPQRNLEFLPR